MSAPNLPESMRPPAAPIKADAAPAGAARAAILAAPDPAFLTDPAGDVLTANMQAAPLVDALQRHHAPLRGLVLTAAASGAIQHGRILIERDGAEAAARSFALAAVPQAGGAILVAGREVTMEDDLSRALLTSRDRFRDLMACSADFGWETDAQGAFTYISPGSALGYGAKEMLGRRAADILPPAEPGAPSPFAASAPVRDRLYKVADKAGRPAALRISAVPVIGGDGGWRGARGVARDVTAEEERAAAQALDQAAQALLARIALAIRSEAASEEILARAAAEAGAALAARAGSALRSGSAPPAEGGDVGLARAAAAALAPGAEEEGGDAAAAGEDGDDGAITVRLEGDGRLLTAVARAPGEVAGALAFERGDPWRAHEIELVHGIAGHLAVALKQADMVRRLEALSRTDALTGLLNRRALFEAIAARIGHQRRSGRPACLLYIDLDHFKQVNDTLGHKAGDQALAAMGGILAAESRVGDLAGRVGGDEFALWLEDTDIVGARAKGEALLARAPDLRAAAGDARLSLSLSIGVAESDPARYRTAQALADAADQALYAAKRAGRAGLAEAGGKAR